MQTQNDTESKSPIQRAVAAMVERRERLAQMKADYEAACRPVQDELTALENGLLNHMNTMGVDSVRVGDRLLYTQIERKPVVQDWKAFGDFILAQGDISYLQKRAAKGAIDEYMADNREAPPGVDIHAEKVLRLRKA